MVFSKGLENWIGRRVIHFMKATLVLANGNVFSGTSIGSTDDRICEMVFNTSMTGYQEILTDPSYAGQGIVMSYPLIGNYGINSDDNESRRPWAAALVVRHQSPRGSNFRCEETLDDYLKKHDIAGIEGIDTRALTKILRNEGSMSGMVTCAEHFNVAEILKKLGEYRVEGTVELVSRTEIEECPAHGEQKYRVAVLDLGVKQNMIECLRHRGCDVTVFPYNTTAETILAGGFDGAMFTNGPGDPADNLTVIEEVKKIYDSNLPIFAVCLGHQLLALATGASTGPLDYGHRGGNHPVRDIAEKRVFITSQNHGYMVLADTVDPAIAEVSHVNINDNTVEGLRYKRANCFTVQFHPEASPGPKDTEYLFDRFISSMGGDK